MHAIQAEGHCDLWKCGHLNFCTISTRIVGGNSNFLHRVIDIHARNAVFVVRNEFCIPYADLLFTAFTVQERAEQVPDVTDGKHDNLIKHQKQCVNTILKLLIIHSIIYSIGYLRLLLTDTFYILYAYMSRTFMQIIL